MGLAFNLTDTSLLVQKAYGNIRAAEALAAHEAKVYNPQEMSWLMTEGHDYFFRSYADLKNITSQLFCGGASFRDDQDGQGDKYHQSCTLVAQAMELGRLFVNSPEQVEKRKDILKQLKEGLEVFHYGSLEYFRSFIQKFSDYVTRDIKFYE